MHFSPHLNWSNKKKTAKASRPIQKSPHCLFVFRFLSHKKIYLYENDIVYDFLEVFAKVADGFFSDIGGFEAFVPTALGLSPKIKI